MLMDDLNEIITHLGEDRDKYFNAVAPPIIQTSNFAFKTIEEMRLAFADEMSAHLYTRGNNPTVAILRKKIAALEKAEDALIVGSGASAVSAAIIANVKAGDHVICVQKPYSWTYKLLTKLLSRFGVSHTFVDGRDIDQIRNAITPTTTVLYLESPNTLTFELQDLEACAEVAKEFNLVTIIDNSHASPIFQNPIEYGIDVVVHSATKYLNGHSDVVAGVICGSSQMIKKIFESEIMTLGLIISPNDAAMIIRGLRTLKLRVIQSDKTARELADYLYTHPQVEKIYFPHHHTFGQYDLAKKQMSGAGGLITFKLKADRKEQVLDFVRHTSKFLLAVSWGGYESLMMPSIMFHDIPGMDDSPIHWTMVRLYIGLEDADYLIADLEKGFKAMLQ
jgi:cystathionine beta-lyase/cystathionine gamma-synthase